MQSTHTTASRRPLLVGGTILALCASAATAVAAQDPSVVLTNNTATTSKTPGLDMLSSEFQLIARTVEPTVAHIEVRKGADHGAIEGNNGPDLVFPPGFPEEFRRFFENPNNWQGQGNPGNQGNQRENQRERELRQYDVAPVVATGSGWVYDSNGTIVTNNHVVKDADAITVKLYDGSEYPAHVEATDPSTDIAVLKIDAKNLPAATLATAPVSQGDIVFAFGSPLQFEFSMSQGIVAGMGRHTGILGPTGYENFIQTDAAINPGNSGGPLTNIHGEVVGMNTAIVSRSGFFSGMGFAIPASMIRPVVQQLISSGKVSRGYLGVMIQDDPMLLRSFGYKDKGVVVGSVVADGPAADAGIHQGDIITAVDGQRVKSSSELRETIAAKQPGSKVRLSYVRNGEADEATVTLGEIPGSENGEGSPTTIEPEPKIPHHVLAELGIERASTMTADLANQFGIEDIDGVLVETVRPTSVAAEAGVRPGDVITAVMDHAVKTAEQLDKQLDDVKPDQPLRLTVRTGDTSHYVVMELPTPEKTSD